MSFLENEYIQNNFTTLLEAFFLAFAITFFTTPIIGRIAKLIGAIDLPASMRKKDDSISASRINHEPKLKMGGAAIFLGFAITILLTDSIKGFNLGIVIGLLIIVIIGILDDKFELPGKYQLLGQFLAATAVVIGGISVTKITLLGTSIPFDWFSALIRIGGLNYILNFPGDLLTILWIVAIINFINWVGAVDALNSIITAIITFTMMLLALSSKNILFATILVSYFGALNGYIPFNYNPSKLIQGTTGDTMNGYLLAVFAIIGGTTWTSTFIILALPVLDALFVIYSRLKRHPEVRKNPLKLLSISDTNHLHHRLMAAGYSKKMVLLIESAVMIVICSIGLYFSGIRKDFLALLLTGAILFTTFAAVAFLKDRYKKDISIRKITEQKEDKAKAVVKVIVDNEEEKEKFKY